MIKVMGQCVDDMRWNDNPRLVLELYSLRLTQPFVDAGELLRRIEATEKGAGTQASARVENSAPSLASSPVIPKAPALPVVGFPVTPSKMPPADSPAPPLARSVTPDTDVSELWKKLLSELWKKPTVASHMERAHLKSATAAEWVIGFHDAFAMSSVQRSQDFLLEMVAAVAGRPMRVRFVQEVQDRREGETATVVVPSIVEEKRRVVVEDARVQKVLDVFKGKIRE